MGLVGVTNVRIGQQVEFTHDEMRKLAELAAEQLAVTRHFKSGWAARYIMAHNEAGKVIRKVIDRAQAKPDPRQMSLLECDHGKYRSLCPECSPLR